MQTCTHLCYNTKQKRDLTKKHQSLKLFFLHHACFASQSRALQTFLNVTPKKNTPQTFFSKK